MKPPRDSNDAQCASHESGLSRYVQASLRQSARLRGSASSRFEAVPQPLKIKGKKALRTLGGESALQSRKYGSRNRRLVARCLAGTDVSQGVSQGQTHVSQGQTSRN